MKVYRGIETLPKFKKPVITIGSFDGLHLGHQKILEKVISEAQKIDGESLIITFDPHPRKIIYPKDTSLQLLSSIDEKIKLFSKYALDHLVIVEFSVAFSQLSADEYIEKFLIGKFNPAKIIIGYDHRFGLNRKGDINFLKWYQTKGDFEVIEIPEQEIEQITISSTKIRKAINEKNITKANTLLGYPYPIMGKVVKGERIGHTLGFPTANLSIAEKSKLIPSFGIYAVYVYVQDQKLEGMMYIGDRPTLEKINGRTIEINIFNFDNDIYGETISIEVLAFVREDIKFENLNQLKDQLFKDKVASLSFLEEYGKSTQNKVI